MISSVLCRCVIATVFTIAFWLSIQVVSAAWTSWSYQNALTNYPVAGGTMDGQTGASWWDGSELRWKVWAGTWTPYSDTIQTYVLRQDKCSYTPWTFQMDAVGFSYATTAGTSGIVEGDYLNCSSGHDYRVYYSGWRKQYSGSAWEGANAYTH
jgi:hypothetical protein